MYAYRRKIAAATICLILRRKQVKRSCWVRNWIERRSTHGAFATLTAELRMEDHQQFRNFIRMTATDFEHLLQGIATKIKKNDTKFRKAISPAERLMVTLRFLASGLYKETKEHL